VLAGFIEEVEASRVVNLSPTERRAEVLTALVRYFGSKAGEPLEYVKRTGATTHFAAEWTEDTGRPVFGLVMEPHCVLRSGHSIGRGRRPPLSGTARWRGRSLQVSARRRKSCARPPRKLELLFDPGRAQVNFH
jgi:hypothetical protein